MDYEQHRKNLEKHSESTARAAQVSAVAQSFSAAAQAVSAAAQMKSAKAAEKAAEANVRTAEANELVAASTLSKLQFERDVIWLEKSDERGKYEFFIPRVGAQVISSRAAELSHSILVGLNCPTQNISALASTQSELDSAQSKLYADYAELQRVLLTPYQVSMDNKRNDGNFRLSITYGRFWKERGLLFKTLFYLINVLLYGYGVVKTKIDNEFSIVFLLLAVLLIVHWRLLWVFGQIDTIDASKVTAMKLQSRINALKDKVNEQRKQLGSQLRTYRSRLAIYYELIRQDFDRQYEDEETTSAMKDAIRSAEQEYPSTCRIKQYPTSTGFKEYIRAQTISSAYSQVIARAGLSSWSNWMSRELRICRNCAKPIESGAQFCLGCGSGRVTNCSKCVSPLSDDVKFCGNCGTIVANSSPNAP
jgi:hypothetical protein